MGTDMKDEGKKYFNSALRDFTFDVACGAAIRHLHELGYTPEQIAGRLDYPISVEKVKKYVSGLSTRGAKDSEGESYEIVRDYDEYGRSCFVRVKKR
ncbi:MAG: hypothetical protein K5868_01140 [Lachnospiraceae bacterium]|nr:hypothetical protein [Lachnospiraceae bacterium]